MIGAVGQTGGPGLVSRGAWAAGTAYQVNDLVTHDGSTYRRIVAGTTPTNPARRSGQLGDRRARGIDGTGAVSSVNGLAPDGAGNVQIPVATGGSGRPDASGRQGQAGRHRRRRDSQRHRCAVARSRDAHWCPGHRRP
ncbi:carbohydrate-binding protein [Cupriavidus basilensis]